MCLRIENDAEICRAETDIECWKVLRFRPSGSMLTSPYYDEFVYKVGQMSESGVTISKEKRSVVIWGLDNLKTIEEFVVNKGLHSFANMEEACEWCAWKNKNDSRNFVLVRCHIPMGTLYVSGFDEVGRASYVSERLFVDELIFLNKPL